MAAEELERLVDLPGLGPRSAMMLSDAGIETPTALAEAGAVAAFARVRARQPGVSLNLLWALEGALSRRPWQRVAREDRARLLFALDDLEHSARIEV